jgi:peptidoglycan/LPS O-acetylase OafA/YrhL
VKRYDILDGMRGIAAISVMVMHATNNNNHPVFHSAYIAVDFFFILSGFVLAHSYGPRSDMNFSEFLCRRLIRLYPMFLIGLVIGAPILIMATKLGYTNYNNKSVVVGLIYNIFYIPFLNNGDIYSKISDTVHGPIFPANDPSWSLFFEIIANFFFFALFRSGRRRLIALVIFCFAAIIVSGILLSIFDGKYGIVVAAGWGIKNFIGGFPRVFYGFSFGVLLNLLVEGGWFKTIKDRMRQVRGSAYLLFAVTIFVFWCRTFPTEIHFTI